MLFHIKFDLTKLNWSCFGSNYVQTWFAYSSLSLVMFKWLIHLEERLIASLLKLYLVMKSYHFRALACNSLWIVRRLNLVSLFGFYDSFIGLYKKAHAKTKQRSSCKIIHFDFRFVLRDFRVFCRAFFDMWNFPEYFASLDASNSQPATRSDLQRPLDSDQLVSMIPCI